MYSSVRQAEKSQTQVRIEELTHWKRPWCWERLKAGGEGDDRGWGGWMASPTQWTQVWVDSRSWCWIGRSGVLQSMGLQRIGHDCVTELNWTEIWILKEFIGHITQKYRAKEWTTISTRISMNNYQRRSFEQICLKHTHWEHILYYLQKVQRKIKLTSE